ncbi:MAG TPA: T9SS type A sorting domain-containing protein, partial [Saprospiraceae bacterium]|nr:T9SS type A sorting domain-containing protein [Saprospiraceae bacterium]
RLYIIILYAGAKAGSRPRCCHIRPFKLKRSIVFTDFSVIRKYIQQLLNVLSYDTKVSENDATFQFEWPYVAAPWSGTSFCSGVKNDYIQPEILPPTTTGITGLVSPDVIATNQPNPFSTSTLIKYHLRSAGKVTINIYDQDGKLLETLVNESKVAGDYEINWNAAAYPPGVYVAAIVLGKTGVRTLKLNKTE